MKNNMSNAYKPVSWCGRPDVIQNFCVTFSHNFNHQYSRITNHFVIKGAPVTKETALKIAEMLFPDYTDIIIESIENDEKTLAPSEYYFLQGMLKEKFHARMDFAAERRKDHPDITKMWDENKEEKEYNEYLLKLIHKMEARMNQFPVYHT
jgi:hypothetical protein